MIKLVNIQKSYGKKIVLNGLNFNIVEKQIIGIIGENGCGKSTLLKIVLNLIKNFQGKMLVEDTISVSGFIEDPAFLPSFSGRENLICFVKGNFNEEKFNRFISLFKMEEYIEKKFSKYSLGMKQRLGIVYAMMSDTKLIVLDEPTSALDPLGVEIFKKLILEEKQNGKTIIFATHSIYELRGICDKLYFLKDGVLIDNNENNSNYVNYIFEFASKQDISKISLTENEKVLEGNKISKRISVNDINKFIKLYADFNLVSVYPDTKGNFSDSIQEKR